MIDPKPPQETADDVARAARAVEVKGLLHAARAKVTRNGEEIEITALEVVEAVCAEYNVDFDLLVSRERSPAVVEARWAAWTRVRDELSFNVQQVAEAFGRAQQSIREGLAKFPGLAKRKRLPITKMNRGPGVRRDDRCENGDDCIREFCRVDGDAGACHCPPDCPDYQEMDSAVGYPQRSGIDTEPDWNL